MAIELSPEQRKVAILEEATFQLVVMKQYLSDDERAKYLWLVERYADLFEREEITTQYEKAWG